jgi:hypothetical protein
MEKAIEDAIKKGLEDVLEKRYQELKAKLLADLEREKVQIFAGITLEVMRQVQVARQGDEYVIRLIAPKN